MIIYNNKKKIEVPVKHTNFFGKFLGLMFRTKNTNNLLFEFNKETCIGIHSFFVFFDFLAIWTDDKNNILEYKRVSPFRLHLAPKKRFSKLIEIPINSKNRSIIKFFVDKGKI